jgi:hypothetical protein
MSDLASLITQYGYHIAIVALLGSLTIELLKKPLNIILSNKFPKVIENAEKFDLVAFIFSFIIAVLYAVTYSLIFSYTDILVKIPGGTGILKPLSVLAYLTNIFGTWLLQTMYYSIYKKTGIKRLLKSVVLSISNGFKRTFDTNKDGRIEVQEALLKVQSLLTDKKLDKDKVIELATDIAEESIKDFSDTLDKEIQEIEQEETEAMKQKKDKVKKVAKVVADKEEKQRAKQAKKDAQQSAASTQDTKVKKATIKF